MEYKRESYIDFAKGVAIYLVVLGHMIDKMEFSHIYAIIASFHMPLFFFLSGIAMNYTRMENAKYILRKVINLLIPFATVGGGYAHIVFNTYMFSSYWYLSVLFCYSIFIFINKIIWKKSKVACVLIDIVFALLFSLLLGKCKIRFIYSLVFYFVAYFAPFLFGVFYIKVKGKIPDVVYFLCLFIVFLIMPLFDGFVHHSVYMHLLKNIIGISLSLLFLKLFQYIDYENKVVKFVCFVGKNTMPVYLFHFYMIDTYTQYGEILGLIPNMALAFLIVSISILIGKLISVSKIMSFFILGIIPEKLKKYFY